MPLPGSDKYRVPKDEKSKAASDQERANEAQDVLPLLWALGCKIPSEVERSWKFHCPFGTEHSDQGMDKAARYYGTTGTAYCFAGHDSLTAVKLVAFMDGLSYAEAAKKILKDKGLDTKPETYQERFQKVAEASAGQKTATDITFAIQALREYCGAKYGTVYLHRQYDHDVREAFVLCVDALSDLSGDGLTIRAARVWLDKAKQVMDKVLDDETH